MAAKEQSTLAESFDPNTPEPMLRFTKVFDFSQFVNDHLIPSERSEVAEMVRSSARLIGQSRDSGVLFAWDKKNNAGNTVTSVGWFTQFSPAYRTLYHHESQTNIVAASVNHERTLLTFTIKDVQEPDTEDVYDSFIAEIQPQGRIFTLDIQSPEFRLLQFIQPDASTPKNRMGRSQQMSHLLIIVPGVLICIYHIKMQVVRLGAIMVSQPEQETIQKRFTWYQWDPRNQWLYYARFESGLNRAQASALSGRNSLVLHCKSFSYSSHQHLFTLSLPLPSVERNLDHGTRTYFHSPFSFTMPSSDLNLQVLHRSDGFWCVCLQHSTGVSSSFDVEVPNQDSSHGGKIDYSVYIIHNGYVLYGQVPLTAPTNEGMRIHFMLLGCFVAAYIPGFMLHLLNVGPRVDPCHHLTFGPELATLLPSVSSREKELSTLSGTPSGSEQSPPSSLPTTQPSVQPVLTSALSTTLQGETFLECNSSIIYECSPYVQGFFNLFKRCSDPVLMEDLLHLMVVGFRHHGLALSMIEHICQTPMRMFDHRFFAEFIIASSFANVYFDCKKYFAKQLPLTTSPTFHGKVYKNQEGVKLALLKLSPISNLIKQLLVQSDQKLVAATPEELLNYSPPADQPFEVLCHNAVISQPSTLPRVDIQTAVSVSSDEANAEVSSSSLTQSRGKPSKSSRRGMTPSSPHHGGGHGASSFLGKLTTLTRRSQAKAAPTRLAQDPHDMLTFLVYEEQQCAELAEEAVNIRDKLVRAIAHGMSLRARNEAHNTVASFYSELEKHSCTLLLVIWQSLGFNADNHPLNGILCRSPTIKEQILYELLEAYNLCHLEIGIPLPNGFNTFYAGIGFLSLDKVLFLQYMRNNVFVPTKRFVDLLLDSCDEDDAPIVFQIFCNLEYRLAEYALSSWCDPTVLSLEKPNNVYSSVL